MYENVVWDTTVPSEWDDMETKEILGMGVTPESNFLHTQKPEPWYKEEHNAESHRPQTIWFF